MSKRRIRNVSRRPRSGTSGRVGPYRIELLERRALLAVTITATLQDTLLTDVNLAVPAPPLPAEPTSARPPARTATRTPVRVIELVQ